MVNREKKVAHCACDSKLKMGINAKMANTRNVHGENAERLKLRLRPRKIE